MTDIRKGQAPAPIERAEFSIRFHNRYQDPAFDAEKDALARLEAIAWDAYTEGRKAPVTEKAGMFVDWEGRVRMFGKVLQDSHALPDLRVLSGIADEMGAADLQMIH